MVHDGVAPPTVQELTGGFMESNYSSIKFRQCLLNSSCLPQLTSALTLTAMFWFDLA